MNKFKKIILLSIPIILFGTTCFASNKELQELELQDTISINEVNTYKANEQITSDNINYRLIEVKQIENKKKLQKEKEVTEELIVLTNNKYSVLSMFDNSKEISEDGYNGVLNLQIDSLDINVNDSYEEEYKVYMQKVYENVPNNELNNIPKEIEEDGIIYYLINPVWEISLTEKVDNKDVPIKYTGTMYYEGIKIRTIIRNYKAQVKYEGILEKEVLDSITFDLKYQEIPNKNDMVLPVVVSASGIIFFSGIIIITRKDIKIYNYDNKRYVLVKKTKLNKNNTIIDITPIIVRTNRYKIVLSNQLFKKLKNTNVKIKYFDRQFLCKVTDKEFEINV